VSRSARRYYRTLLLALAAMALLVWAAMDQFGISADHMLQLFAGTLIIAALTILLAALCAGVWILLRSFCRHRKR
jgi:ABC-type Na+ efflux pump permease subunit